MNMSGRQSKTGAAPCVPGRWRIGKVSLSHTYSAYKATCVADNGLYWSNTVGDMVVPGEDV